MKPAGPHLLFFVVAGTLAAQPAEPAPPAKTSARLTQEIRATLPKFVSQSETAKPGDSAPGSTSADPNLLVLPTVTVKEKPPPWLKLSEHLTDLARKEKFARDFKNSLEGLDAVLNSFPLPLFAPPIGERIRAAYEAQEREHYDHLGKVIRQIDSKAPAELQKDLKSMQDAEDWRSRPAGSGRVKVRD